ncbi:MAG: transcription factor S [Candidatus Kariarchaeaceae archaeon]
MDFCDDCGSMLQPKTVNGRRGLFCHTCDKIVKFVDKGEKEKYNIKGLTREEELDPMLVLEGEEMLTRPTMPLRCSECRKMTDVEYWELQTRSADESPTRFFRCTICKKTWREYD